MIQLDVKTRYSVRRGKSSSAELLKHAPAGSTVAITDKETMGGWFEHESACKAAGVEPVFGVEVDVAGCGKLVLLCESDKGVKSLYKLARQMPKGVTYQHLAEHNEGVVALTGHLSGAIPSALLKGDKAALKFHTNTLLDIFGRDRLFLEQVDWGLSANKRVNTALELLGKKAGLRTVVANDVHYPQATDWLGQAMVVCDDLRVLTDMSQLKLYGTDQAYMRELPECNTTKELAERLRGVRVPRSKPLLPKVTQDDAAHLRAMSLRGLEAEFGGQLDGLYLERFEYEMRVILEMGFASYFLIVADFVQWAKSQGIIVGAGRGSGAGSLVGWGCGITAIDPVRHNLYFERFLNPERVSIPDYDIDFCAHRREEVVQYIYKRWGHGNVVGIAAYGEYKLKEAWKAACRVFDVPPVRANDFSKRYLDKAETFAEVRLNQLMVDDLGRHKDLRECFEVAEQMVGAYKASGHHPGGTVVLDRPAYEVLPVDRFGICMFDKFEIEQAGAVKYDILGVKELTSLSLANAALDFRYDLNNLPENDELSLELLRSKSKLGTFQVGKAMSSFVEEFKPERDEDVAIIIALRRPGPMDAGMDVECARRKNGELPVVFPHEDLAQILGDTYGVMAYQEQVMRIGQQIAGMTMGGADIMRRAIGKKNMKLLMEQKQVFIDGGIARGYDETLVKELWDLIEKFANYGFNRAHAAGYAKMVLQTAFFKAHHPDHFMAAQCRVRGDSLEELAIFLAEVTRELPMVWPDINTSPVHFCARQGKVLYGLESLRGMGTEVADRLRRLAPFEDFEDFYKRSEVNKGQLEALLYAGALDGLLVEDVSELDDAKRGDVYARIMGFLNRLNKITVKGKGQGFLFARDAAYDWTNMPQQPAQTPWQVALKRYEMMGAWGPEHPIKAHAAAITHLKAQGARVVDISDAHNHMGYTVQVVAVVQKVVTIQKVNNKGEHVEYARLVLEDCSGGLDAMWFRDVKLQDIPEDGPARVWLQVDFYDSRMSYKVARVSSLDSTPWR